ncbi:MAG: hypothetical protein IT303_04085 [Dehalococcoidia bacterium]|nr:hypothetical protein [Dehalococcoidia bacterium]
MRVPFVACALVVVGSIAFVACGGGDDDDDTGGQAGGDAATQPGENGGSGSDAGSGSSSSSGASDSGRSDGGSSGGAGTASVEITGVERFTFDITCSFGTGIIEGPGTRDDGEPAYLRGGVDVTDSGEPREDGEAVAFGIKVGIAQLAGQADYEWTVGETAGRQDPVSNDGKTVSGTAGFEYRDDRAEPRFAYGEVKDAIFDMNCP